MKKISIIILLNLISILIYAQDINKQAEIKNKHIIFNISTGISVPVKGENYWNTYWNPNYLFSGTVFYRISNRAFIGIRAGYNSWSKDEKSITSRLTEMNVSCYDYISNKQIPVYINEAYRSLEVAEWPTNDGKANVTEIGPAFRYIIISEYNKSYLFLQAGVGYSKYSAEVSYNGYYQIYNNNVLVKQYFFDNYKKYDFTKTLLNIGLGVKGGRFEVLPLYNVILTPDAPTHFVALNIGLTF